MVTSPDGIDVLDAVRTVVDAPSGFRPGDGSRLTRCWVAYSGGVDSTVLLDAAARTFAGRASSCLAAVHVNHGLHPDAGKWEHHCRETAARLGIRIEVRRVVVDTGRDTGGIEAAARAARHAAFGEVVSPGEPVLLAHQRDDQAETVLLRILRGAATAGIAAMRPEVRVGGLKLVRPFIAVPRSAILAYAAERRLSWVEDPGNRADAHDRNYVRHHVVPTLTSRWPAAAATLARLADRTHESASMLDDLAALDLAAARGRAPDTLSAAAISALPPPRAANAVRSWLVSRHRIAPPPRRWLRVVVEEVAAARADGRPEAVRAGIWVRRYRGDLHSGSGAAVPRTPASTAWRLDGAGLELAHGRLAASPSEGAGLASARIPATVEVRFRTGGERCRPAGREVTKPLKVLFQEHAVPPWERGTRPLVYAGDDLAAVPGLFVCDPYAARGREPGWHLEWRPHRCG